MSTRRFTGEQINALLQTGCVAKCSEKAITYSKEFKVRAIGQYEEGQTPNQIFRKAGFDLAVIGKKKPKNCLQDWRKVWARKGEQGLREERRGGAGGRGRPKTKWLTDAERINYLETKVAYLKAENDFLAKLRARRGG